MNPSINLNSSTGPVEMGINLAWFIESLCSQQKSSVDSVFKCVSPVQIQLPEYGQRLGLYMACDESAFVSASIFIERLYSNFPQYFCSLSAHKLMCASVLLGVKFNQDLIYANSFYAETFGISLIELNKLESVMLQLLGFSLFIDPTTFNLARARLLKVQLWKEQERIAEENRVLMKIRHQQQYEQQQQQQMMMRSFSSSSSSTTSFYSKMQSNVVHKFFQFPVGS